MSKLVNVAWFADALLRLLLEDAALSSLRQPPARPRAVPVAAGSLRHKHGHSLVHGAGEGAFSLVWEGTCLVTGTGQETAFVT